MHRPILLGLLMILFCAGVSFAQTTDGVVRSVESFDFLIDASGGMRAEHRVSLENILKHINSKIPELGHPEAGIHTFAPEKSVLDFSVYNRNSFDKAITRLMSDFPGGKNTSLGKALDYYAPGYSEMQRKGAVIVFTDGDYGRGRDSLNEVKIFYLTQPNMCLHFVSFAKNDKARQLVDDMASINDCSVYAQSSDILNSEESADEFVKRIFYSQREVAQAAAPLPAHGVSGGNPAPETPVVDFVQLSIAFGFDSFQIDNNTARVADVMAERLLANPDLTLKIDGYTCNIGRDAYNKKLSSRRAESVKQRIAAAGVAPSRITIEGHGSNNPRYDNATREGRSLNRRVEFTITRPAD